MPECKRSKIFPNSIFDACQPASALKDLNNGGQIFGIDPARLPHMWEDTDLKSLITWIPTLSQDAIPLIEGKKFDLLVLDSDHSYKTVMWELIHFEKYLEVGGHILMHDSLYFDGVGAAVAINQVMMQYEATQILEIASGFLPRGMCLKILKAFKGVGSPTVNCLLPFD